MHNSPKKHKTEKPVISPCECLTTGQAAYELSVAPGTLQNWRSEGIGPKFFKHRHRVYYLKSDLEAYKRENFVFCRSTADWKGKGK